MKGKPWLKFYPSLTGEAGESQLTISAPADVNGRSAEVLLKSGSQTQHILIIQGLPQATAATCAEVIAGPDAKTFMVTGTVTSIANTTYGNFYLQDNTGTIYIYGTLDKNGNEKNFSSLGIEAGDEVTVTGPKTTYGSTVELVNVTVNKINKSLIKVDSTYVGGKKSTSLPFEGGTATVYLTCKGKGVSVSVPEDAKSWLKLSSIDQNGQSSVVSFEASSNHAGPRSTTLTFNTTDGSKNYTAKVDLAQAGESGTINVPFTVSEAISYIKGLGDATSPSQVYIKGTVSEIAKMVSLDQSLATARSSFQRMVLTVAATTRTSRHSACSGSATRSGLRVTHRSLRVLRLSSALPLRVTTAFLRQQAAMSILSMASQRMLTA